MDETPHITDPLQHVYPTTRPEQQGPFLNLKYRLVHILLRALCSVPQAYLLDIQTFHLHVSKRKTAKDKLHAISRAFKININAELQESVHSFPFSLSLTSYHTIRLTV